MDGWILRKGLAAVLTAIAGVGVVHAQDTVPLRTRNLSP